MADGQVVFEITADGKKAMASIDDITKAFQKAGKEWDQSADSSAKGIENKFVDMFKKISVAAVAAKIGKTLLDIGSDAIAAASDLREVQNVVDVTFGSSANQIESWAKKAQTQFGLTETQAKRFTSTLGAMMKSAGLAGPEIVSMSTDLAGLAADMASFYNMDFETAFQKIRSGISGETEPLKQLGINMSVANLEAYALSQGITKAFDKMSQGEQTMLRYQYLMQATADAQGDFARTSDGYANAQRRVQTAMESIKTSLGELFLPTVEGATAALASFLERITAPKKQTVLDEFAAIDLDTASKIAELQSAAKEAETLISVLGRISETVVNYKNDGPLANFISQLSGDISGLDSALKAAKEGDVKGSLTELAGALSVQLGGDAEQWSTLLTAISGNLPGATSATMSDKQKTAAWMKAAADAADDLGGDYSKLWANLLSALGDNAASAIAALAGGESSGGVLEKLASGANLLKSDSPGLWTSLFNALKKVDGLENIFSDTNAGQNVRDLADALSGNSPDVSKAEAWNTFLSALQNNSGALSALTQTSADETAQWLGQMADAANKLTPANAEGWDKLFSNLLKGLPGLENSEGGESFLTALTESFLAMGSESETAKSGLQALGWSTEEIAYKQKQWLETCRSLVTTIPALSDVINTETGEVNGGTAAINENLAAWRKAQEDKIYLSAYYAKQQALAESKNSLYAIELIKIGAEERAKAAQDAYNKALEAAGSDFYMQYGMALASGLPVSDELQKEYDNLAGLQSNVTKTTQEAKKATDEYNEALENHGEAVKMVEDMAAGLAAKGIDVSEAAKETAANIDDATEALTALQAAASGDNTALDSVKKVLEDTADATKALADYVENVRAETARTVSQTINGFTAMGKSVGGVWQYFTPAEQARQTLQDLTKQMNELRVAGEDTSGLEKTFADTSSSLPTIESMTTALQSQAAYMKQYQDYLDKARAAGVSEDILATLSDGTQESFDYLQALSRGGVAIKDLNKAWKEAKDASQAFTDTLTNNKLTVDEEFQQLLEKANEAIEAMKALDPSAAASQIVADIASGIAAQVPSVAAQVDAVLAELDRLNNIGSVGIGGLGAVGGVITFSGGGTSSRIGSHADGLDYVPFDGYLSQLHEGESILTAEEARVWRQFKYNQQPNTIDYGMLGTAMWENAPQIGGGNVYLNGQIVGRVMSAQQADSLRAMERSGFQK